MFSLNKSAATELEATDIDDLFKTVLESETLCQRTFNEKPLVYESKGIETYK